jgi:hypothetical protein
MTANGGSKYGHNPNRQGSAIRKTPERAWLVRCHIYNVRSASNRYQMLYNLRTRFVGKPLSLSGPKFIVMALSLLCFVGHVDMRT